MAFEIKAGDRSIRWDDGWSTDSSRALVRLVEESSAVPLPLVHPSPVIEVDWGDEVWLWLHTIDVLGRVGEDIEVVERPALPEVPPLPEGVIA